MALNYAGPVIPTPQPSPVSAVDSGLDWGSIPNWFAAVGTILAVGISIYLARRDGKRLEVERREAAEDRAEFRRLQAQEADRRMRQLASQVTLVSERGFDSDDGKEFRSYRVHNNGDEPISLVTITERPIVNGELSPTGQIIKTWPIIEGGGERIVRGPNYFDHEFPLVRPMDRALIFRDGLGQRWLRNELGVLRTLGDDDPESPGIILLPL